MILDDFATNLWPQLPVTAKTVENYKGAYRRYVSPDLGKREIASIEKAEYIDEEEWELVSEEEVHNPENEQEYVQAFLSLRDYDKSNEKSTWGDKGLYKLRYQYSQNISENSRDFCKEMVRLSKGGALFRYEDIQQMQDENVNDKFAPSGASNYSVWHWKGGVYCHHFFKRKI